jgi:virginiamycin B lyase
MAKPLAVAMGAGLVLAEGAAAQNAVTIPDHPAKQIVDERCGICHALRNARSTDYSPKDWRTLIAQMRNIGLPLTDAEYELVTTYLAAINPERARAPAKLIAGPQRVSFREWKVRQAGVMPRDAVVAANGSIWFTAQFGNLLIEVDEHKGIVGQHRLRIPYSGPMGIGIDGEQNIWFAANRAGYVGSFDPRSGAVREIRMPDHMPPDPSGLAVGHDGLIWFTAQNGNRIGRLDPRSGALRFVPLGDGSVPFAIKLDANGFVFVGLRDGHKILRLDPETLAITEFPLPDAKSEPRRMAISPRGFVWYTDIDRGFIGRLDPATGAVREFASPSGPTSTPHAIATVGETVWYVESKALPNTLVRFDPATERFQSWAIPSGYALVRDLAVTKTRNLAFAGGSSNTVGIAEIAR